MKFIFLFFLCSFLYSQNIELLHQKDSLSFRGLSILNDSVVWVSGNKGTVLKSENAGKSWLDVSPAGYEKHDFRDIEVVNDSTAIIMAIASPGIIMLTKNSGKTWKEIYRDEHPDVFLDAIIPLIIKDKNGGEPNSSSTFFIGDPIEKNTPYIGFCNINIEKCSEFSKNFETIEFLDGEAFFAASGTNMFVSSKTYDVIIVSGGIESNFYYFTSPESKKTKKTKLPLLQGKESTGANSITFNPNTNTGMVVGGDFLEPDLIEGNSTIFTITPENEIEFTKPETPPNGYRSCVDFISDKSLITCGLNGVDISNDGGLNWEQVSKESYHVCLKARNGNTVFLAGRDGKIGKLNIE